LVFLYTMHFHVIIVCVCWCVGAMLLCMGMCTITECIISLIQDVCVFAYSWQPYCIKETAISG